ncbi:MAG: hypothetical protein COA78_29185 [Blastopirellula sp.]|nr:MAG: hypothetical protein COA78_29185 [Blastopirellula sp.]
MGDSRKTLNKRSSPQDDSARIVSIHSLKANHENSQVLVIDPENTVHDSTVGRRWLFCLLTKSGHSSTYESFYRSWDEDYLPTLHAAGGEYWAAFAKFLKSKQFSVGHIDELVRAVQSRFPILESGGKPFTGVPDILSNVRDYGYSLHALPHASLSGEAYQSKVLFPSLGDLFDKVTTSSDLDRVSNSNPFEQYIQQHRLSARRKFYLSSDEDRLQQAKDAGFTTMTVNNSHRSSADHALNTWADIIPLCGSYAISRAA